MNNFNMLEINQKNETSDYKSLIFISLLCVLALYMQSINFDFFIFDDGAHIGQNKEFLNLNIKNLFHFLTTTKMSIVYFFWQIIGSIFGVDSPVPFRILNFIFHALNGLLIYKICYKRFIQNNFWLVTFITLFWWHPLQVESVIWISSFKGILSTTFALLSLLSILSSRPILISILFVFLSLTAKPSSIGIIPILYFIISFKNNKKNSEKIIFAAISSIIVIYFIFAYYQFSIKENNISEIYKLGPINYLSIGFVKTFDLIIGIFIPFKYSIDYGQDSISTLKNIYTHPFISTLKILTTTILLAGNIFFYLKNIKFKTEALLFLNFLISIIIISGLIPQSFHNVSIIADRYYYYPLAALTIFILSVFGKIKISNTNKTVAIILIALVFITSSLRINIWKSNKNLLIESLNQNNQSMISSMALAKIFYDEENYQSSELLFKKITSKFPENLEAHKYLLDIYARQMDYENGVIEYQKSLEIIGFPAPDITHLYYTLLRNLQRYNEAFDFIDSQQRRYPDIEQFDIDMKELKQLCIEKTEINCHFLNK